MPTRTAEAVWTGPFRGGGGTMKFGSFQGAYSAASRFEDAQGTNPEELIGAAHAGCFSMAFALALGEAGFQPEQIRTTARVTIEKVGPGFKITGIALATEAKVPGIDEAAFWRIAQAAKRGCPVSQALAGTTIELEAKLLPGEAAQSPQP